MSAQPAVRFSEGPYQDSAGHLRDELARVDLLVRAQVSRWRLTIGASKPPELWGMVHVSEAEIRQYLAAPVAAPDLIPECVLDVVNPIWQAEAKAGSCIRAAVSATRPETDSRLRRLKQDFCLNDLEYDLVLLCLLPEVDSRYRRVYGYLQDDASRTMPPVDLLLQMLHPRESTFEIARLALDPGRPLLRDRLLVLSRKDESCAFQFARLDERIVGFLLGSDQVDERLSACAVSLPTDIGWEELFLDPKLSARVQQFAAHPCGAPVMLRGAWGSGREEVAGAIAGQLGRRLLKVEIENALRSSPDWRQTVDLAFREARLLRALLYFDGVERLQAEDQPAHLWNCIASTARQFPHPTFLAMEITNEPGRRFRDSDFIRFDFPVPHHELRKEIWDAYLPTEIEEREELAAELAGVFQFTEGQVAEAVKGARAIATARSAARPAITSDDLYEASRKQAGRRLVGFARRIEPTQGLTLDDVILGEQSKTQLKELLNRVRLRSRLRSQIQFRRNITQGNGLLALFVGPSGTGKTLSAELVANEQGVDLYKVDLSAVVSKWVGETEKNLNSIFAEAEDSDALLFFDECDSLFGQRGEIADGRDRWANLQVNFLLQRVEEYSGVVIMATNLRRNIDEAFLRRIQVIIEFPAPDAASRLKIWKRSLPVDGSAVSEGELRAIAERFTLTGGSIRNIVIDAAFRALGSGRSSIIVRDLVDSVAREYQKLGKPITQGEFGEAFYAWAVSDILSPITA